MPPLSRSPHLILIGMLFLFSRACGASDLPTATTGPALSSTPSPTERPTITPTITPTDTPLPPTSTPTRTRTGTPTYTVLPPIPDFDKLIAWSYGAANLTCPADRPPDTIVVSGPTFGTGLNACFWLKGLDPDKPFQIKMELQGSASESLMSPDLNIDWNNNTVKWEGLSHSSGHAEMTVGGFPALGFSLWLPDTLSPGQWRIYIQQGGSMVDGFSTTFQLEKKDRAYVSAFDSFPPGRFVPGGIGYLGPPPPHWLHVANQGKVRVHGIGFPAGKTVYVLLYAQSLSSSDYTLTEVLPVRADEAGSFDTDLVGRFNPGMDYFVFGISDPHTSITRGGGDFADVSLPLDHFWVEPPINITGACPGAVPQRLAVRQRGVVCTQKDPVPLRDAPGQAGKVLVLLKTGSPFTVKDGPICVEDWSWWQIRADEGHTGWIPEGAGDPADPYYICPLP